MLDLKKQACDPQALEYVQLARVSLVLGEDVLQSRSFVVIQTLVSQQFPTRVTMFIGSLYDSTYLHSITKCPMTLVDLPSHGC